VKRSVNSCIQWRRRRDRHRIHDTKVETHESGNLVTVWEQSSGAVRARNAGAGIRTRCRPGSGEFQPCERISSLKGIFQFRSKRFWATLVLLQWLKMISAGSEWYQPRTLRIRPPRFWNNDLDTWLNPLASGMRSICAVAGQGSGGKLECVSEACLRGADGARGKLEDRVSGETGRQPPGRHSGA